MGYSLIVVCLQIRPTLNLANRKRSVLLPLLAVAKTESLTHPRTAPKRMISVIAAASTTWDHRLRLFRSRKTKPALKEGTALAW